MKTRKIFMDVVFTGVAGERISFRHFLDSLPFGVVSLHSMFSLMINTNTDNTNRTPTVTGRSCW